MIYLSELIFISNITISILAICMTLIDTVYRICEMEETKAIIESEKDFEDYEE